MAGPDLTFARETLEGLMLEEDGSPSSACKVTRDEGGVKDDAYNAATLELTPPVPDATTVYEGACLFRPLQSMARDTREGGASTAITRYRFTIPLDAPEVRVGDDVALTINLRDPTVVGKTYRVTEPLQRGFAIGRGFICERREDVRDRP